MVVCVVVVIVVVVVVDFHSEGWCCQVVSTRILDTHDHLYIQGVPGGMDKTSGECSLC